MTTATPVKSKYLVALPCFAGAKGFNHRTILVSAKDEMEARATASYLSGCNIGDVKKVNY
jgi:hypothetical protein